MTGESVPLLAGRRVLVTRRREQAVSLSEPLRALGATVLELPLIEIRPPLDWGPLDEALVRLSEYHWLVFTSANAVEAVAERRTILGLAGPLPKLAVVGPATREALVAAFPGRQPDLEPARSHHAQGLLEAFVDSDVSGRRVLLPSSDLARDTLPAGLRRRGALVDAVIAYRTVLPEGSAGRVRALWTQGLDLVVFASPSAVEGFVMAGGAAVAGARAAVIGPLTEAAARMAGLEVVAVAKPSTAAGLVAAIRSSEWAAPDES